MKRGPWAMRSAKLCPAGHALTHHPINGWWCPACDVPPAGWEPDELEGGDYAREDANDDHDDEETKP